MRRNCIHLKRLYLSHLLVHGPCLCSGEKRWQQNEFILGVFEVSKEMNDNEFLNKEGRTNDRGQKTE